MTIKKAVSSDIDQILQLQKIAYKSEAEIYNDFTIQPLHQTLEESMVDFENQIILKHEDNGKITGSVRGYLKEETCYIGKLIVHPEYQNRGIGTRLIKGIEELFNSALRFELFTGFRSEKNLYLYNKMGYAVSKSERVSEKLTLVYLEKSSGC